MDVPKIYISGPMSGYPEMNKQAFDEAVALLQNAGYAAVNPHDIKLNTTASQSDYIKADIKVMMDCDGVATLEGWHESWGANIEVDLARRIPMPVRPLRIWCLGAK